MSIEAKQGEHPSGDAGQLIFFGAFLIVWAGDSFFLHLTTDLAQYVPLAGRLILLILCLIAALLLFKLGHVAISDEERPIRVIKTRAFRYVRHPLYLASILTYLGLTVSTSSLSALVLFVAICLFYNYLAGFEEKIMVDKFGAEYSEYIKGTGKWLPRIHIMAEGVI